MMNKIIIKYFLKEFIKPFFVCCFIFLLLFNFSEGFRAMNINKQPADAYKYIPIYLGYQTIIWMMQILPMSLLLGFLFSYGNLSHHNEITAIKAGGINLNRIFLPIILLSLLVSGLALIANEKILPIVYRKSEIVYKLKVNGAPMKKQDVFSNINYLGKNNSKFLIKSFNAIENKMYKINIDTFSDIYLKKQIYAKYATWKHDTIWEFEDGIIRTFDTTNPTTQDVLTEEFFIKKEIDIEEKPDTFAIEEIKPEQLTIKQLKKNIIKLKSNSIPVHRELTAMYHKIAFPFANTIVILIGIAFASASLKNNKVVSFAVSLVVSFMYWGITSVFISIGSNGVINPLFAAWATNLLFLILSVIFMTRMRR